MPDAELALARVAARVAQGGHNITETVVRRRFAAGIENFHQCYKHLVDAWLLAEQTGTPYVVRERSESINDCKSSAG